ncbi:MAG: hypothetical protein AB1Z98_36075 [Nannocystaceae bacterium]
MAKKRFLLRIDPQLYDALQRWASDELRSVNAQMEFLLGEALRKAGRKRLTEAEVEPEPAPEPAEPDDEVLAS